MVECIQFKSDLQDADAMITKSMADEPPEWQCSAEPFEMISCEGSLKDPNKDNLASGLRFRLSI
jgi:hypothetical protein